MAGRTLQRFGDLFGYLLAYGSLQALLVLLGLAELAAFLLLGAEGVTVTHETFS